MRYRPFLLAIPWVLVLIAAPEFLGNAYSLRLPPTFDARSLVFGISIAIMYSAPVVGIVLAAIGLVKRVSPVAIHGGVTCLLSLGILAYAHTIPPKRFFAADLTTVVPVGIESAMRQRSTSMRGVRQLHLVSQCHAPNKWLQLTAEIVTPFAYAKGAPISSAAEPGC